MMDLPDFMYVSFLSSDVLDSDPYVFCADQRVVWLPRFSLNSV